MTKKMVHASSRNPHNVDVFDMDRFRDGRRATYQEVPSFLMYVVAANVPFKNVHLRWFPYQRAERLREREST